MNNNNTTNNKFTAALVTESTKHQIVELRNETGLSEKELMTILIDTAIVNRNEIIARATEIVEAERTARAQRKADAYANLKLKMQQARAEIREAKLALKQKIEAEMKAQAPIEAKPKKKKAQMVEA